ncbi:MAG TPA: hypothetical protein VEI73_05230 [Candidatus Acidoferrum sp.]|nr:hypothetical protein [Candidatus Acidoferrum sp.]
MDLVYELPKEKTASAEDEAEIRPRYEVANGEEFQPLVEYPYSTSCADACLALRDAGIPYRVKELPRGLDRRMESLSEFQIAVPDGQFKRAKELLGIQVALGEEADFPDDDEVQAAMELPAADDQAVDEIRDDSKSEDWYPEDASVEIWSGDNRKSGQIIEMSLRENGIHFRAEAQPGLQLRIFVLPVDEARAREIVREIVEGAPPE